MRKIEVAKKWKMLALIAGLLTAGLTALLQSQVSVAGPGPDCGPTREWNCVIPGCPECPEILFEGTVCEKAQFENATGRVCSPA